MTHFVYYCSCGAAIQVSVAGQYPPLSPLVSKLEELRRDHLACGHREVTPEEAAEARRKWGAAMTTSDFEARTKMKIADTRAELKRVEIHMQEVQATKHATEEELQALQATLDLYRWHFAEDLPVVH